jgi:glycosyltransferase involved in cell wall biosynthesis
MRLLLVIAELGYGGAERIVAQLADDAARRGDRVAVASAGGPLARRLEAAGIRHYRVALGSRSLAATLAGAGQLAGVLRDFRPEIVHAHNVRAAAAASAARHTLRRRPALLTTLHGVAPGDYQAAARTLRLAGGPVIACAPAVARSVRTAGFPADRLGVVTNGAALAPAPAHERAALRAWLGVTDRPLVVGLGRLVAQKSWVTLVEASKEITGADIVVAGDGPLRADLEAAGEGVVRFVGVVEHPAALLGLATCVVSTSVWEGLPLGLLEALSLGLPVVATAVDGVRDVVPAKSAILVPPGDPAAVAAAVNRVIGEPGLAERLSGAARRAAADWAPDTMLARYRDHYAAAQPSWSR